MSGPLFAVARVDHKAAPVRALEFKTWPELARGLTKHRIGPKDGPAWMPARIEPGDRKAERVADLSALALGVEAKCERQPDGTKRVTGPLPPPLQAVAAELELRGISAALATSYSHQEPTGDDGTVGPRYRVAIVLSRPILPDEVKPLGLHVARLLGLADAFDAACLEPARLYYLPRCPAEREHLAEHAIVEGRPLDVDAMLSAARAATAPPPGRSKGTEAASVIDAFNAAHDVGAILESHGYRAAGRDRWVWPQSTTGEPGVVKLPDSGRIYSHHGADPLAGAHSHDAFSAWCVLMHGGDMRTAAREAARLLGMDRQPGRGTGDGRPADAACEPWPDFDPLPELRPQQPAPFPFDGLGPILGPAARAIAETVQAPDSMAAGSVLAAASLAAQAHADVLLPHGDTAPLSLFIVTSASSGDRKSATDKVASEPIETRRRNDAARFAQAMAQWREDQRGRRRGEPDDAPAATSLVVSKGTTEGLHHLLRQQSHLGLFSPEGAELLAGHSMREDRRAAGIAWMLKAWGAETLDALTRKDGLSVLYGRRLALHVLVQPVILRDLLADPLAQGQGLVARCLVAQPATLAGTRLFCDAPPARQHPAVLVFHEALRRLLARPLPIDPDGDGLALQPRVLDMSAEARALWVAFYDAAEREQAKGGKLAGVMPWASKAAEHAARVAGVLALTADPEARAITTTTMRGALAVADFYLGEHVRLQGQSQQQQRLERLHALLQWLRERGASTKHADVLQFTPRPLRDLKAEGLGDLLRELAQRGYIRRTAERWEVRRDA